MEDNTILTEYAGYDGYTVEMIEAIVVKTTISNMNYRAYYTEQLSAVKREHKLFKLSKL